MDIKSVLAALAVTGFFAVLTALFFLPIPEANGQLVNTVVVALISIVSAVIGYYFGSSEGSARKTELMSQPDVVLPDPGSRITVTGSESGFARLRLLLPLAFLTIFLAALATMHGCATPGKPQTPQSIAAKSLLSSRQAIIAAGMTADTLCAQGVMKQAECDRAGMIYRQAQAAYATASDAFIIAIQTGNAQSWRDYEQTVPRLMALTMDLDTLVKSFRRSEK